MRGCETGKHKSVLPPRLFSAALATLLAAGAAFGADSGVELGAEDDLTVFGTEGTVPDPDVEIKGFTIFGSTNVLLFISTAPGNTVFNGAVQVSSDITAGRYQINGSTVLAVLPGADSLGIGVNAGRVNAGVSNVFAGSQAGYANTTGTNNTFAGSYAGNLNAIGSYNSFFGSSAGRNTTSNFNSFFGAQAGMLNTAGTNNSFVGNGAGRSNTTGSYNTFIGHEAGYGGATGNNSVFAGYQAGYSNTGTGNIFVGHSAGGANTSGSYNVFAGDAAGLYNTIGSYNSFFGKWAGAANTTGAANLMAGYQAGRYNQTGSANIILGHNAGGGGGSAANSFSSSTVIGYLAGGYVTTGSDNILLGFQAGDSLTTGSRNIIIGYDEDAPAPATNDYINIGGLLVGDMVLSSVTVLGDLYADKFYGDISGATGLPSGDNLGNHTATQNLNLAGFDIVGVSTVAVSSITTTAPGITITTSVFLTAGGRLGVGTESPSYPLHVNGIGYVAQRFYSSRVNSLSPGTVSDAAFGFNGDTDTGLFAPAADSLGLAAGGVERLTIDTAGNVGISTNAPEGRLDVKAAGVLPSDMAQIWRDGAGVIVGSMSATGVMQAVKFLGDGSGITGISGDNLGNHVAAATLQMGVYGVNSSSDITAARYQVGGLTVLAALAGSSSLGVGVNAGKSNAGNYNSFLGYNAGYSNTGGNNNSFVGYSAGSANLTGNENSFVGYGAGFENTTGSYNSYVGFLAGYKNMAGTANSILGYEAGKGPGLTSYSSNTLVGFQAGYGLTTGSDNILLGFRAGTATTTGTRNIIVGYEQDAPTAATNNFLNIGGVLYGDLSARTIGISTRAPQAALDIVSTGTTADVMAQIWRDGNGVIVGSMSATGIMEAVKFLGDGSGLTGVSGSDNLGNHTATQDLNMAANDIYNADSITASSVTVTGNAFSVGISTFVIKEGNVGIGTAGPSAVLEVNTPNIGAVLASTQGLALVNNTAAAASAQQYSPPLRFSGQGWATTPLASQPVDFRMSVRPVQGTANPTAALDIGAAINNGAYTTRFSLTNTGALSSITSLAMGGSLSGATTIANSNTHTLTRTGLGNTSTDGSIQTNTTAATAVAQVQRSPRSRWSGTVWDTGAAASRTVNWIAENIPAGGNPGSSRLAFSYDYNAGGYSEMISLLSAGNVGISTNAPEGRLDVKAAGVLPSDMAQIWRDGAGVIVGSMSATGVMQAVKFLGDGSGITGISGVPENISVSTINAAAATPYGGVNVTSHVFVQGNLGIGTSAPGSRLDVAGGSVTVRGDDALPYIAGFADAGGSYRLAVSTAGGVAMGTAPWSGNGHLEIAGDGEQYLRVISYAPATTSMGVDLLRPGALNADWRIQSLAGGLRLSSSGNDLATTNTYLALISGGAGVFDLTPDAPLEVSADGSATGALFLLSSDDDADGDLLTVTRTGMTGIGAAAPGAKLEVKETGTETYTLAVGTSPDTTWDLVVTTTGKAGIGVKEPQYPLDVAGDLNLTGVYRKGGTAGASITCPAGQRLDGPTVAGGILTGGTCVAPGAGEESCPSGMIQIGDFCVDKYEASVWSSEGGGTQYGASADDYPCNDNGQDCSNIYARSVAGVTPSGSLTWFQADAACRNSGKRLLTNAEWQSAARGTPDPGALGVPPACNVNTTGPTTTGAGTNCLSNYGVENMIGSLLEWVADWGTAGAGASNAYGTSVEVDGTGTGYNNDRNWNIGGNSYTTYSAPAGWIAGLAPAVLRGGAWGTGDAAGVFALNVEDAPSVWALSIGFRCGMSLRAGIWQSGDLATDLSPQLGGDLDVNGHKIVSANGGDIVIQPDGAGEVLISTLTVSSITTTAQGVTFSTHAYFMNGNVGIGTNAPASQLDLQAAANARAVMQFSANNGGANINLETIDNLSVGETESAGLQFRTGGGSNLVKIENSGNMGVGTSAPGAKLHAVETSGTASYIFAASTAADAGSYKMVVSTTGKVGIGTAAPAEKLTIGGTVRAFQFNAYPDIVTYPNTRSWKFRADDYAWGNLDLRVSDAADDIPDTHVMSWTKDRNVGIKTTVPTAPLEIWTQLGVAPQLALRLGDHDSTYGYFDLETVNTDNSASRLEFQVANTRVLSVQNGGKVGIGPSCDQGNLCVDQTASIGPGGAVYIENPAGGDCRLWTTTGVCEAGVQLVAGATLKLCAYCD